MHGVNSTISPTSTLQPHDNGGTNLNSYASLIALAVMTGFLFFTFACVNLAIICCITKPWKRNTHTRPTQLLDQKNATNQTVTPIHETLGQARANDLKKWLLAGTDNNNSNV